ncbi:MAG TPA: hypothetical protein VK956_16480 [Verrucomicrobium sp.]|nr:hypothetical protein [Verrucomicrobium sp.]
MGNGHPSQMALQSSFAASYILSESMSLPERVIASGLQARSASRGAALLRSVQPDVEQALPLKETANDTPPTSTTAMGQVGVTMRRLSATRRCSTPGDHLESCKRRLAGMTDPSSKKSYLADIQWKLADAQKTLATLSDAAARKIVSGEIEMYVKQCELVRQSLAEPGPEAPSNDLLFTEPLPKVQAGALIDLTSRSSLPVSESSTVPVPDTSGHHPSRASVTRVVQSPFSVAEETSSTSRLAWPRSRPVESGFPRPEVPLVPEAHPLDDKALVHRFEEIMKLHAREFQKCTAPQSVQAYLTLLDRLKAQAMEQSEACSVTAVELDKQWAVESGKLRETELKLQQTDRELARLQQEILLSPPHQSVLQSRLHFYMRSRALLAGLASTSRDRERALCSSRIRTFNMLAVWKVRLRAMLSAEVQVKGALPRA